MEINQTKETGNEVINTISCSLLDGKYIQAISLFNVLGVGTTMSTPPSGYVRLQGTIDSFKAIEFYTQIYASTYLHLNNITGRVEMYIPNKYVIDIEFLGVTTKGKFLSNNYLIENELVKGDEKASERASEDELMRARDARRLNESKLVFKEYLTVGKFIFPRWSYTQQGLTCDIKGKAGLKRNFPYLTESEINNIVKRTTSKYPKPTRATKLIDKFKITYHNKDFYMANERIGSGAKLHTELSFHGEKVSNNTITQIKRILQKGE